MKLAFCLIASLLCSTAAIAQEKPAQEKPSDRPIPEGAVVIKFFDAEKIQLWAQCSWEKMPVTSPNLFDIHFNSKKVEDLREIPFASPIENLNTRLNAVCGELLDDRDRNSPTHNVQSAKIFALKKFRPEQPKQKDQKIQSYICAHKISGQYVITERDLKKPKPQDAIPFAKAYCFKIEADGSLTDA
ncbi:hypothetical protein LPB140_07130 [Sphingorhabdus lutea]|uniref:Uncharacterized protein n=1 Tax=Sphingorhabdus lutea TaxID=1913578 RepID=A0A1L3JBU1_9SPHN|nr:hypothetical protein [Sphingorhabdus lutea]APG62592.1 hypothetical protein LPB140_07130 [Sphingorhabdus lutea]